MKKKRGAVARRSFACSDEDWKKLEAIAVASDQSVSQLIRRLIRKLLAEGK